MAQPTAYEYRQYEAIRQWRTQAPSASASRTQRATNRVGRAVGSVIPAPVLRVALQTVQAAAARMRDQRSILRRAGVQSLEELDRLSLQHCDATARYVKNRALLGAGTSGAVSGVTGAIGLAVDIPALLVIAFRSIHRLGLCYGEDCMASDDTLPLAIFALASANTLEEKQLAWAALGQGSATDSDTVRSSTLNAVNQSVTKSTATLGFSRVARQASTRLGWRLACTAIPVAGAVIGGSVNAWYAHEVAIAAEHAFQWRWLLRHYPGQCREDEIPAEMP